MKQQDGSQLLGTQEIEEYREVYPMEHMRQKMV